MTSVAPTADPAATIPRECGCGCGAPINPYQLEALALRRRGLTVAATACELGITEAMVKMAGRQFSRYRPGHQPKHKWEERTCRYCKGSYRTAPTSNRSRCRNCPKLSMVEQIRLNIADFDAREADKNRRMRERRFALIGGRPPRAMGTPKWLQRRRDEWERVLLGAPPLTAEQERLVVENRQLVPFALKRFYPPAGMDDGDLQQVGFIGLMQAARKFDAGKGFKFSTFAVACIQNEARGLLKHLGAQKRVGDLVQHASLDALAESGFDPTAVEDTGDLVESAYVDDVLSRATQLDERLPDMLRRRMDGETLGEVAKAHNLSAARVSQILGSAAVLVDAA